MEQRYGAVQGDRRPAPPALRHLHGGRRHAHAQGLPQGQVQVQPVAALQDALRPHDTQAGEAIFRLSFVKFENLVFVRKVAFSISQSILRFLRPCPKLIIFSRNLS